MFTIAQIKNLRSPGRTFCLVLCGALLTFGVMAQTSHTGAASTPADKEKIARALSALRKGNLTEADIYLLVQQRSVEAIPDLKKQFWITDDVTNKEKVAAALVRLGDKDPAWWDYLTEKAGEAINSDLPDIQQYDANGKAAGGPSPEFLNWAKVHSLTADQAERKSALYFSAVAFLGESGNERAIPLLRQGLVSPDSQIQILSARGLAQLQDKASIPMIIDACERAPTDAAFAIASALENFDTPEARSAVKRFQAPQSPK